jgi:hypothetical protein
LWPQALPPLLNQHDTPDQGGDNAGTGADAHCPAWVGMIGELVNTSLPASVAPHRLYSSPIPLTLRENADENQNVPG